MRLPVAIAIALATAATSVCAADQPSWNAAFRYRLEQVDQTGFDHHALAATARLRLGVKVPINASTHAFVEGEAVWAMNDHFNSGANGQTSYPGVADANAREINQAGVAWHSKQADTTLGRQRVAFDNQRFIGNVGWRQNEQTFDAVSLALRPNERTTVNYVWLDRVHRIAGDHARDPLARERDLAAHLLHATFTVPAGSLAAYCYAVEDQDLASASSRTSGVRWTGALERQGWRWSTALELAQQRDYANNPQDFTHAYRWVEAGLGHRGVTAKLGWEQLVGNGRHALQTPLATLHAFNGWADVFLVTPAAGLDDRYVSLGGALPVGRTAPLDWSIAWHTYEPTQQGTRYGREWNASLATRLGHGWSALVKFADYRRDGFGRDTRKIWAQVEWAH